MSQQVIDEAMKIHGQTEPQELHWLHEQAKRMGSVLEIGSYRGRSTYALASGCQGMVYAVDPFDINFNEQTDLVFNAFMANMARFHNIAVLQMTSEEAAAHGLVPAEIDMVFIDANHDEEPFLLDLMLWAHRAQKLVCGHDFCSKHPGIQQALHRFMGLDRVMRGPESIWYFEKGDLHEAL